MAENTFRARAGAVCFYHAFFHDAVEQVEILSHVGEYYDGLNCMISQSPSGW